MADFVSRTDSWRSALTGLGGRKDKRNSYGFVEDAPLDPIYCEQLFNGNDLAQKICSAYADEALRMGVKLEVEDDTDTTSKLAERIEDLDAVSLVNEAAVFGAMAGDAGVWMAVEDGREQSEPLEAENVQKVHTLRVVCRMDLSVASWYSDPLSPKFDTPETFRFISSFSTLSQEPIHETRFLWFYGARTSRRTRKQLGGWHYSKLQAAQVTLRDFNVSFEGAAYMLQDASQAVFKIKDLISTLVSDQGQEMLERRMESVEMSRSVARAMLIDADMEDFSKVTTTFTGVPDILDRMANRLAAATGIPVTKLMGQTQGGLNANGDADQASWYDAVEVYRTKQLKPQLVWLSKILAAEMKLPPEKVIKVCFPSLYQMTPIQEAALRLQVAQTDKLYADMQALTPEEIAMSRFRPEGWNADTQINTDVREAIQKQNEEDGNIGGGVVAEQEAKAAQQAKDLAAVKQPAAPPAKPQVK